MQWTADRRPRILRNLKRRTKSLGFSSLEYNSKRASGFGNGPGVCKAGQKPPLYVITLSVKLQRLHWEYVLGFEPEVMTNWVDVHPLNTYLLVAPPGPGLIVEDRHIALAS